MPQTQCTCGTMLQYSDAHAGKKLRCPKCQAIVQAPDLPPADAVMVAELVPTPSAAISAERPRDRGYDAPRTNFPDRRWPDPEPPRPASGKATLALVFGILSLFLSVIASLFGILFGVLGLRDCSKNNLSGRGAAIVGIVLSCLFPILNGLAILGFLAFQTANHRVQTLNNLKQIGLAWHSHHDVYKKFPGAGLRFVNGQPEMPNQFGGFTPVQNWRVSVLPYLEQESLYRRFDVKLPFDEEPNKSLIPLMPKVYEHMLRPQPATLTLFQSTEGKEGLLQRGSPSRGMFAITDGTSNTFMVLEAQSPVTWTEPKDIVIDPQQPLGLPPLQFMAGFADGSVRVIDRRRVDDRTLRNLINPADGNPIAFDF